MPLKAISRQVYRWAPRPSAGRATPDEQPVKAHQMLVITRYPNPTFSYYFEQRLFGNADKSILVRGLGDPLVDIDPNGLFVVFCRYASSRQINWVRRHRDKLVGVALFIDDDVASILAGAQGTWHHKLFLAYYGVLPLIPLNPQLSQVWVSTDHLADGLQGSGSRPKVLRPLPPPAAPKASSSSFERLRMAYHATNVHRREHEFLVPIVRDALLRHPQLEFEVFANGRNARLWSRAGIDPRRLVIRHTLPWIRYVEASSREQYDIALVPLLETRTNASRADTKRIDVMRMGAAAIYSAGPIFGRCAIEGEIHILNTADQWAAAIDLLVADTSARDLARQATFDSIEVMRKAASINFPCVVLDTKAPSGTPSS